MNSVEELNREWLEFCKMKDIEEKTFFYYKFHQLIRAYLRKKKQ